MPPRAGSLVISRIGQVIASTVSRQGGAVRIALADVASRTARLNCALMSIRCGASQDRTAAVPRRRGRAARPGSSLSLAGLDVVVLGSCSFPVKLDWEPVDFPVHFPNFVHALLPHLRGLRLECVFVAESGLTLDLTTTRLTAHCPLCSRRSRGVHSRYQRTLADLPWGGRTVVLHVQVRRFCCRNRRCPRAIFAERLPQLVMPRARRTLAQHALLLDLACALGGQPGARLARRHGLLTSRATSLRLIARACRRWVPRACLG